MEGLWGRMGQETGTASQAGKVQGDDALSHPHKALQRKTLQGSILGRNRIK